VEGGKEGSEHQSHYSTTKIQKYIRMIAPTYELLRECLKQLKPREWEEEGEFSLKDKPLHGIYHRQIKEVVDIKKSYQWLEKKKHKSNRDRHLLQQTVTKG